MQADYFWDCLHRFLGELHSYGLKIEQVKVGHRLFLKLNDDLRKCVRWTTRRRPQDAYSPTKEEMAEIPTVLTYHDVAGDVSIVPSEAKE